MIESGRPPTRTFRVGLILTERCNASCDHCCIEAGPDRTVLMEPEEAEDYIEQALEISTVQWISFSGGEPLLFPKMLQRLVVFASGRGLRTECVTNCFWAENEETALSLLKSLQRAGLEVVNISTDDFHQRHVPFQRVYHCYWTAKHLGLKVVILCTVAKSSTLRISEVIRLLGDGDIHVLSPQVPFHGPVSALAVETPFLRVGRGAGLPEEERIPGNGFPVGPCRSVLKDISILPSGQVLPCCSPGWPIRERNIGNARERRLAEILMAANESVYLQSLAAQGPTALGQMLNLEIGLHYVSQCDLCHDILSEERLQGLLCH